jgi:hypothetical protein
VVVDAPGSEKERSKIVDRKIELIFVNIMIPPCILFFLGSAD